MMKEEFEKIAKVEVTAEQYNAIELLYAECKLDKYDFVKSIKPLIKHLKEINTKPPRIIIVELPDNSGYYTTPNGCWQHLIDCEVVKEATFDISTGKTTKPIVRKIPNSYRLGYGKAKYEVTGKLFKENYFDYEVEFKNDAEDA